MTSQARLLSISEVAAATGLRPSALRYYEEEGLIAPAARRSGRRHYEPSVVQRLAVIALCQDVGFTIAEVREVLEARGAPGERWQPFAERKLAEVRERIAKAREVERLLLATMTCGCGELAGCDLVAEAGDRRRTNAALPHARR